MALISLDHVSKIYPKGTRPALDDVNLDIERGDFVFLVGASGSGKTTLLSLLLREEEATDGEIRVAGNDLRRISDRQVPQYRRTIGFVFQDYKLLNNKTVWQNVAFALEVIGTRRSAIRSMVPKVLETVGLTGKENNYPHELSGGEQQRVAIARAYVNHPQILLADEPTGNLDPTTSLGIMEVLDAINRTGTTIVMATHNEEIVNSMRKRVVELHTGRIVRDEEHGSYDSAVFFPDAEVTSKAHQAIGDARFRAGAGVADPSSIEDGTERMDATVAIEAGALAAGTMDGDEGIARLAQSVHSGRTGRYGEAFAPVETTLTWGKGLNLDEIAKAKGGAQDAQAESGDAQVSRDERAQSGDVRARSGGQAADPQGERAQSGQVPAQGAAEESDPDAKFKPQNGLLAPPAPPAAAGVRRRGAQDAAPTAQETTQTPQESAGTPQVPAGSADNGAAGAAANADASATVAAANGGHDTDDNENGEDNR
ncbi:cell division ATP-binding protein FtsE [Bifidobacterium platyrrhinorum]|uniref:Cell division ATP-binding protein FtsE n=1 Tax=Bifidobacterium platyrrhinorum TaxID=2661628 RepID=A0A6L9SUB2_9BIFI|nr:cell division ATP-binding protein FtsE [Bifidobacterium platyrrhinorum]NEG56197.1 cell division ATP-binding protein FtsE [Bifidobacterium platyrrhinorum]